MTRSHRSLGTVLALGQEKHICNLDCHLAYSVMSVNHPDPERLVATVRVRFDPETIPPRRGEPRPHHTPPWIVAAALATITHLCTADQALAPLAVSPDKGDRK